MKKIINIVDKYLAAGGSVRLYKIYKECDFNYSAYKLALSLTPEETAYIDNLKETAAG